MLFCVCHMIPEIFHLGSKIYIDSNSMGYKDNGEEESKMNQKFGRMVMC